MILVIAMVFAPHLVAAANNDRIALIIGNGSYRSSPLKNPVNDAEDIAKVLRKLGFSVTLKTDSSQRTMETAIHNFGKRLRSGGIGLFYYAGHGMQVKGSNYLIPVGANIQTESDIKYKAVDAGQILGKMEDAGNDLNIVILDACRDNPFARSFRSSSRGLARMDAPKGSLIAYATAPGSVAADGAGRNGIYTKHFLRHVTAPGLKVEEVLKRIRNDVMNETGDKQVPWESSSLTGDFYFNKQQSGPDSEIVKPKALRTEKIELPSKEDETSFADILRIEREQRQAKEKWKDWQDARDTQYRKVKDIDKSDNLTPKQKSVAWKRFLVAVSQNNPYSQQDDKMRSLSRSRLSHWENVKPIEKQTIPADDFTTQDSNITARDGILVAYASGVVYDRNTGLEWYAGPDKKATWDEAKSWVENLNAAGGGWRMPTRKELKSLYKKGAGTRNMTSLLKTTGWWVWSGETKDSSSAWYFNFYSGSDDWGYRSYANGLRGFAVRSRR